jgi:hypothetical protein
VAQERRDGELLEAVIGMHPRTLTQMKRLTTKMNEVAPVVQPA